MADMDPSEATPEMALEKALVGNDLDFIRGQITAIMGGEDNALKCAIIANWYISAIAVNNYEAAELLITFFNQSRASLEPGKEAYFPAEHIKFFTESDAAMSIMAVRLPTVKAPEAKKAYKLCYQVLSYFKERFPAAVFIEHYKKIIQSLLIQLQTSDPTAPHEATLRRVALLNLCFHLNTFLHFGGEEAKEYLKSELPQLAAIRPPLFFIASAVYLYEIFDYLIANKCALEEINTVINNKSIITCLLEDSSDEATRSLRLALELGADPNGKVERSFGSAGKVRVSYAHIALFECKDVKKILVLLPYHPPLTTLQIKEFLILMEAELANNKNFCNSELVKEFKENYLLHLSRDEVVDIFKKCQDLGFERLQLIILESLVCDDKEGRVPSLVKEFKLTLGRSLLHLAAQHNCPQLSQFLIQEGQKVDKKDSTGETPLHLACASGYFELTSMMLEGISKPRLKEILNLENELKQRPLDLAIQSGNFALAVFLKERGAETKVKKHRKALEDYKTQGAQLSTQEAAAAAPVGGELKLSKLRRVPKLKKAQSVGALPPPPEAVVSVASAGIEGKRQETGDRRQETEKQGIEERKEARKRAEQEKALKARQERNLKAKALAEAERARALREAQKEQMEKDRVAAEVGVRKEGAEITEGAAIAAEATAAEATAAEAVATVSEKADLPSPPGLTPPVVLTAGSGDVLKAPAAGVTSDSSLSGTYDSVFKALGVKYVSPQAPVVLPPPVDGGVLMAGGGLSFLRREYQGDKPVWLDFPPLLNPAPDLRFTGEARSSHEARQHPLGPIGRKR